MTWSCCINTLIGIYLFLAPVTTYSQSVDPLTGRLQFGIPFATLSANDISIPLGIHHHGGAVRVPEGEGTCGIGWNLSAGGAVSRVVRGLPDDVNLGNRKGWLYNNNALAVQNFTPTADDDLTDCADEATDYSNLQTITAGFLNDTEPDLYYVNAPGLSAQFVFGADGQPKLLIHQDIIIEYTNGNFVVKAGGLIYNFSRPERIDRKSSYSSVNTECGYFSDEINFISAWNLYTITSVATGTTATFSYMDVVSGLGRRYPLPDSAAFIGDKYSGLRLVSVSLKSYLASFYYENDLLKEIIISESSTGDQLKYSLHYTSVEAQHFYDGTIIKPNRALLSKVYLANNSPFAVYEFQYNDLATNVWHRNWGMDYYGYYNGIGSNNNIPRLFFYNNEADGRRLRIDSIPGVTPTTVFSGSNREVNAQHVTSGALTKIILPSGGFIQIEYEANRYWDGSVDRELLGKGVRVKKLITQGGEVAYGKIMDVASSYRAITREYEYKLANNNSSGLLLAPVKLGYITTTGVMKTVHNMGEEPEILYTRVTEKIGGQGKRVYEFNVPGVFPDVTSSDWKATKSRIARKPPEQGQPCINQGNVKNGYYLYPYPPSTNYGFQRGFLTRVSEYSESGTLIREKIQTPLVLSVNPVTLKGLRFERIGDVYYYGVYEMLTGRVQVVDTEILRESSEENSSHWMQTTTQYMYNANNMVQTITSTLPDGTVSVRKIKYAGDFQFTNPPSTDTMAVALKKLNETNRHGEIVEQISRVTMPGAAEAVSSSLVIYRDFGNDRVLPYYLKALPPGAALTESTVSGQNFIADSDYKTVTTLKEYDLEGRLLTSFDDKKNYSATHYATGPSIPIVSLYNAKAQQAVYEGFEYPIEYPASFGLTTSGTGITFPAGKTGSKGVQFSNNTGKVVSSSTNLIQKGGNEYRFSCWVFSVSGKIVTVTAKQGSTTVTTHIINNQNNAWNYIEKIINISAITGPFTLEVQTDANSSETVILDDIVFIPKDARISFSTTKALTGVTSQTDDRGYSVRQEYDEGKRPTNTYDRYGNLVTKMEYASKITVPPCVLSANFSKSTEEVVLNQPVTFTSSQACGTGISYQWTIDGIFQEGAITNVLNFTFTTPGTHNVTLMVTANETDWVMFTETICVKVNLEILITDVNGIPIDPNEVFDCNSTNLPLTFTVSGLGDFAANATIQWFVLLYNSILQIDEPFPMIVQGQYVFGISFTGIYGTATKYMAVVSVDGDANQYTCSGLPAYVVASINYNPNATCQ